MSEVSNPINEKNKQIKIKKKTNVQKIKTIIVDIQNVHINFSTSFMRLVVLIEKKNRK